MITLFFAVLSLADTAAPLKIGYGAVPPFAYSSSEGKPAGFVIDVFNEAARREGIRLEWVRAGTRKSNNDALLQGDIDLLPTGIPSEERKRLFFVSEPWWFQDTVIISRADNPRVTADAPGRLAVPEGALIAATSRYRNIEPVLMRSAVEAAEGVCRGEFDSALFGTIFLRELLLFKPQACRGIRMRTIDSTAAIELTVIARKETAATASRLRKRVDELTADGTLASFAARHPPVSAPYALRMAEALRARYRSERLMVYLVAAALLLGITTVFSFRQRQTHRKLRTILADKEKSERELREHQDMLRERTAHLLRSNEDLQSFAYSISHDLQEPLRNQRLYSQLLERKHSEVLSDDGKKLLQVVSDSAARMDEMLRGLLVYSRLGQSDRPKLPIDCEAVVASVLADLRFVIESTQAEIHIARPLPQVFAWEGRLNQVFQNLLENAIKYRKDGERPSITIWCRKEDNFWHFGIKDNGIGFKPEYAARIFEVFKRLHGRDTYGGSGIGLAVARRIIERHGGRIWAESEAGVGSTFHFTLPDRAP